MRANRLAEIAGALALIAFGAYFLLRNLGVVPELEYWFWGGLALVCGALFLLGFALDRSQWWPLIPGSALVGTGLLFLLGGSVSEQGALQGGELGGAALFLCTAAGFAGVYLYDRRRNWWALIPGGALLILSLVILLSSVGNGDLGGVVLFLGLGLVFVALYWVEIGGQRFNWWTLIPAGALFSLAAVILLANVGQGGLAGSALFLGLGVTFGVLYFLPGRRDELQWAWIPSVALLAFGGFILLVTGDSLAARLFWPLALILAGVMLVARHLLQRGGRPQGDAGSR